MVRKGAFGENEVCQGLKLYPALDRLAMSFGYVPFWLHVT